MIALEAHLKTWTKVRQGQNTQGYITFFGDQQQHASFGWAPTASLPDGQDVPVLASNLTKVCKHN